MEHTPKNLLIRAVKKNGMRPQSGSGISKKNDISSVTELLHVAPTLEKLLQNK